MPGSQQRDRAALIERHGIEDRQLSQTASSREFADKAAGRHGSRWSAQTSSSGSAGKDRGREPSP